jgi:hypothetical protein
MALSNTCSFLSLRKDENKEEDEEEDEDDDDEKDMFFSFLNFNLKKKSESLKKTCLEKKSYF